MVYAKLIWDQIVTDRVKHAKARFYLKHKAKQHNAKNNIDPFFEIAKNGRDTIVCVKQNEMNVAEYTMLSVMKVISHYKKMGKRPVQVVIGPKISESDSFVQKYGINLVSFEIHTDDILTCILKVQAALANDAQPLLINLHIPGSRLLENAPELLDPIFASISQVENHVCVLTASYRSINRWIESAINTVSTMQDFNVHLIDSRSFSHIDIITDDTINVLLFPNYMHKDSQGQEKAWKFFKTIPKKFFKKDFFTYNQIMYRIGDKEDVYFLD